MSTFRRHARPLCLRLAWMAEQGDQDLCITSLAVAEIRRGILEKPTGQPRRELEADACVVVTDNRRDFAGIEINPIRSQG